MRIEIIQNAQAKDVREGTIKGGTATCPCCGYTIRNANVRLQLARHQGGASKARLIAVMTTIPGKIGRFYRLPVWKDMRAVEKSVEALSEIVSFDSAGASEVPCEPIAPERPSPNARGLSAVTRMGMKTFRDLFIPRQLGLKLRISE
jgi:adenine-specific DNA methylase